jgi:hypothetical protein
MCGSTVDEAGAQLNDRFGSIPAVAAAITL